LANFFVFFADFGFFGKENTVMIESFIDRLTSASLRFKWVTIGLAILTLVAGIFALTQLEQELIPPIEFPQTVVLAFNSGLESKAMRDKVTILIEEAVKDIEGVVNIESTTAAPTEVSAPPTTEAGTGEPVAESEPTALPDSWIQAAAAQGIPDDDGRPDSRDDDSHCQHGTADVGGPHPRDAPGYALGGAARLTGRLPPEPRP
jgi:hypothetical protein